MDGRKPLLILQHKSFEVEGWNFIQSYMLRFVFLLIFPTLLNIPINKTALLRKIN